MTTPKLRIDAYYDIQSALNDALIKSNSQNAILQSCLNCINFRENKEECILCNLRPPARVIAYGCQQWEDKDEIPF